MTDLNIKIREANPEDAAALAVLINFAGEGLPLYLWETMADAGEDPWEVGRRRAQREKGSFSYRNTVIAEIDATVAGCLIGYPLADDPEPIDLAEMPAMFVPLQELEILASGTWYINVVAAFPEFRGSGIGTVMLAAAERFAAQTDKDRLSLIVTDANLGARRLYERNGYREIAQRPLVKEQWDCESQNWVLMIKDMKD